MTTRTPKQKANDDIVRHQYKSADKPVHQNRCPYPAASLKGKQWQREEIKRLTEEFLAKGGEIKYLPPYDAFDDSFYNPAHPHAYEGVR